MSLFAELKRRNVFRVAIAYIAGSWLLIQVVETLFPIFGLSDELVRLFVILLFIGFPLVLVVSWVYELTPEGWKLERDVDRSRPVVHHTARKLDRAIIVMLALSLGYFAFDKFILDPSRDLEIAEQSRRAGAQQEREEARLRMWNQKSIAVLPFENRSVQQEDEHFTEGIHDELLTRLARIAALKVISRTSVMRYRDTDKSIPEIAEELGVTTVLEGAVQRAGDRIRVNVQLIDAHADHHLWQQIYDRELTAENLFAVQSDISSQIAAALGAELSPAEKSRIDELPTESLEAYKHYIRGRQLYASGSVEGREQAKEAFEQAVDIDPEFAEAWVGIADSTRLIWRAGVGHMDDHFDIRWQAIDRALELDGELGEAFLSLSGWYWDKRGQPDKARAACRKAVELSPNYTPAMLQCGGFVEEQGPVSLEQRLAWYQKVGQLDPLSLGPQMRIGGTLRALARYEEAIEQYEHVLELRPDYSSAYMRIGDTHLENGRLAEALKWYRESVRTDPREGWKLRDLVLVYIAVRDYESITGVRELMEERLDPDVLWFNWLDIALSLDQGKLDALSDLLEEVPENIENEWYMLAFKANIHLIRGDMESARDFWLKAKPEWDDPEQWEDLISADHSSLDRLNGCKYAGVLLETGDEAAGMDLLRQATDFYERTLPGFVPDSHRSPGQGWCYLVAGYFDLGTGSYDKAFDFFEKRVAHGHINHWWREDVPWWNRVREDPRYIALMERMEAMRAEQRELIRQMDARVQVEVVELPVQVSTVPWWVILGTVSLVGILGIIALVAHKSRKAVRN